MLSRDNTYVNIKEIGERLLKFREAAGLSQEQLSYKSGIPQGTISRIENATHKSVEIDTLHALASSLGLTTSELIGEKEPQSDPKIREMTTLMMPMSEYQKNAIVGAAKGLLEADRKIK